jgi:hypothetical protein
MLNNPFEQIYQELTEIKERVNSLSNPTAEQIEIITRAELLKRLNISEPCAIRWGKSGKIPELRIGSNVRYNWPKVVEALEAA